MERIILESIFISSIIFLTFFYIRLFRNVVSLRRKNKISFGSGNKIELERAIRAHANFIENVPIGLILSMFLYFHNYLFFCCISNLLLLFGRVIHAKGISDINEKKSLFKLRIKGMKLTIYSYYASIIGLICYLIQTFYFFNVNYI